MARKSGFVRRNNRMVRESLWFGFGFTTVTLASSNAVAIGHSLNAAALALRPFTIVRTRGSYNVRSDQKAATEFYGVSMAFAVVTDQAVAIGATAVPTPDTDRGSDKFFVFEDVFGEFNFQSGVGIEGLNGISRDFDSKAMRKVQNGEDIISVLEAPSTSGVMSFAARMLIKLH